MTTQMPTVVALLLMTFISSTWTMDSSDASAEHQQQLLRRYLLHKYRSFKQRDSFQPDEDPETFQQTALKAHNDLRAQHCSPALEIDEEINKRAQIYADILASNDSKLIHSSDRMGRFGENLYSVTRSRPIANVGGDKVTRTWYTEVSLYDYDKPVYSRHTGHFSQIVWKDTKRLGIAYAFARNNCKMYVVAQYGPPGNYGHSYRTNVLPPNCTKAT